MPLLMLVPVLGYALLLTRWGHFRPGHALLLAVTGMLLVLYVAAIADLLLPAVVTLTIFGFLSAIGEGAIRFRRPDEEIPLPFMVLTFFSMGVWLVHSGSEFMFYDEFSHWGIFLREMLASDSLWSGQTNAIHPRYPPAPTLWQYYFTLFFPYSDGNAFLAQFVLLVSPLMVLFESLRYRDIFWASAISALVLIAITNYGHGVASLYVDHVIAAWFAGSLFNFVRDLYRATGTRLTYAAPLVVIALLKDSGLYFSLVAGGIMALLCLGHSVKAGRSFRAAFAHSAATLAVYVTTIIIAVLIWSWDRDRAGAPVEVKSVAGIIEGIVTGESPLDSAAREEVRRRFLDVFVNQGLRKSEAWLEHGEFEYAMRENYRDERGLSSLTFPLALSGWLALLVTVLMQPGRRWITVTLGTSMLLCYLVYVGLLYLSYQFAFGVDALRIPSYVRYVNTAVMPLLLMAFIPLLPAFRSLTTEGELSYGHRRLRAALFGCALALLYVAEPPFLRYSYSTHPRFDFRHQTAPLARQLREIIGKGTLWIYFPQDQPNLMLSRVLQFQMTPTTTRVENSESFLTLPSQRIEAVWRNFDYVWFPMAESELYDHLSEWIAEPLGARLFRVHKYPDGIRLEPYLHGQEPRTDH